MYQRNLIKSVLLITLVLVSALSIGVVLANDEVLGCQKNNPGRPDCSSLEVTAVCEGTTAVFTIRNTGDAGEGNMASATQYRLLVDGTIVETGSVQLPGTGSMQVRYSGSGTITLEAEQQPNHPGNSHPQATLNCGGAAPTQLPPTQVPPTNTQVPPTNTQVSPSATYTVIPPTATFTIVPPTVTEVPPTETPTEEVVVTEVVVTEEMPQFDVYSYCEYQMSNFIVSNVGADMQVAEYFTVTNPDNELIQEGWLQLISSDNLPIVVYGEYPSLTLTIGDNLYVVTLDCGTPTEEANPSVNVTLDTFCNEDGYSAFVISNVGDDMEEAMMYTVKAASDDYLVGEGWLQLFYSETVVLSYPDWAEELYLTFGGSMIYSRSDCVAPTPTDEAPTEEATEELPTATFTPIPPTATDVPPTATFTPIPPTATSVSPTATNTLAPTKGQLGCQKNNPDRLDCSSLEVTATCQGTSVVFTIRNTGELGDGNMVSPTQYRILLNNSIVQTGSVQLLGAATMQVTYSGNGKITLQADQQVGHPGKSLPQASLSCSK